MPITFACACGKTLKVADEHAGKRVKCPACQAVASVPAAAGGDFEIIDDEPPKARPVIAKARPVVAVPAKPTKASTDDFDIVDDDEDDRPRKKRSSRHDDDEEDNRPRSKRNSRREDDEDDDRPRKKKVAAYDDEDDDRPSKKKMKRPKKKAVASGGKRMLSLIGGLVAVVGGGALAYFVWNSEASGRGVGKAIVLGIAIMVGGIGAIFNGITGNFGEDEQRFDDDDDRDEDDRGGGDWDDD